MNCREAEQQLFAERDGSLDATRRAALAAHVAQCASCQRVGVNLTAAIASWRAAERKVRVPDAVLEWQKLRREIRGGVGRATAHRRSRAAWLALPLAAAAALAVTFFVRPAAQTPATVTATGTDVAVAGQATAAENNASTVVFVDDKSGWTFVWASDDGTTHI